MPELDKVAAEMAGTPVHFLAVSLDADARAVSLAMQRLRLTLPGATAEAELLEPLHLETVPSTLFIDASGQVVGRLGSSSKAQLKEAAEQLLPPSDTASRAQAAVVR